MSPSNSPSSRRTGPLVLRTVLIAAVVLCIGAAAYFLFASGEGEGSDPTHAAGRDLAERVGGGSGAPEAARAPSNAAPNTGPRSVTPEVPPEVSLPKPPPSISDVGEFVAHWAARMSPIAPPEWLSVDAPLKRFVAAVNAIALGEDPMRQLSFLRPDGRFEPATDESGDLSLGQGMDARYRRFLALFNSLDADVVVEAFRMSEPHLDRAHRDLGHPEGRFRSVLLDAIEQVLDTPEPEGPVELVAKSVTYAFADEDLEQLAPAQHLMLRLSPTEREQVRAKLRILKAKLSRLPAYPPARSVSSGG